MTVLASLALSAASLLGPAPAPKVDLLVVVDDSASMTDDQQRQRYELPALTGDLVDADWQIAVVTTSSPCLRGNRTLFKTDSDASEAFAEMIAAGTAGNAAEDGLASALDALRGKCPGAADRPWLRDGSLLAMLFVSDEDSASDTSAIVDYVSRLRPADKRRAYALIWQRRDMHCQDTSSESDGTHYRDLARTFGGIAGSICQDDYTAFLERLSRDVSEALTSPR